MIAGYLGLVDPWDTTWSNGQEVTIYPNGDVIERSTGYYVRKGIGINKYNQPEEVKVVNQVVQDYNFKNNMPINNNTIILIFGIMGILAITGVILNGKR